MITEFFGDIIIRKEDVKCCYPVVPGDVLTLRIHEPSYVIIVRSGKTLDDGYSAEDDHSIAEKESTKDINHD